MPTYIPIAGTIKSIMIHTYCDTTAGSNENISMYFRLNNTTDTLIQTLGANTAYRSFLNSALSIAVAAGDWFEIKMVAPTWATNPSGMRFSGFVYVE